MTNLEADQLVLSALVAQATGIRKSAKTQIVGARAQRMEQKLTRLLTKVEEAMKRSKANVEHSEEAQSPQKNESPSQQ